MALRRPRDIPGAARAIDAGDLTAPGPALSNAMRGVAAVVHAAGLAHRSGVDPAALARVNVTAATHVAEIAAARGIQRFILISSAAIYGRTRTDTFDEASPPHPDDSYALSKLDGEAAVRAALDGTGTQLVIVRPCAVLGPGCAGNIPRLARLISRGLPLPFGAIRNARSFIAVDDLAALVGTAIAADDPPDAVIAAHQAPISTPDLIRELAHGLGRRVMLLPVPRAIPGLAARAAGRQQLWHSFAGSFRADVSRARDQLGFVAPTPIGAVLRATGASLR